MSFNPWKFFNQLKDTASKITTENSVQTDFLQVFTKLPQSFNINEFVKLGEKKISTAQEIYNSAIKLREIKSDNVQKWKEFHEAAKAQSFYVSNQTSKIIESVEISDTEDNILRDVEMLISHIKQYPEMRNKAVKNGAILILLRKKSKVKSDPVKGSIREALTRLGYADPVPGRGIRILSMDGGGIKGVLVLEMLKKLEEITGKKTHELFDFFCGVSTGAILSYSMGIYFRNLEEIIVRYEALSQEIFKRSSLLGTGNLVWSHAYYNTALWEKKLEDYLGNQSLISTSRDPKCPKLCTVSAVVNQSQVSAYVFRNYSLPWRFQSQYPGSYETKVWQAARASAAAPTYFEEFKLGNLIHQDGGILVNNPTAIAVHEAKLLWPNTPIQCVVSFGTGRSVPTPSELTKPYKKETPGATSWTNKFYKILDSATDTEAVHIMLSDLLPENVYYRFNPYLTEMIGLVETDQKKQKQLKRDALMYLRRNEDKFQEAARTLLLPKTFGQKVIGKVNLKREIYGI